MLSTLLLYPTCPECGGNLPFVSRHYAMRERPNARFSRRSRWRSTEIRVIRCPSCDAVFSVQERGLGVVLMVLAAVCVVGYLGWGGSTRPGIGFLYFFGGSALALFVAWLVSHRMTVLTRWLDPDEASRAEPEVADVFAQLEARDAQLEREQKKEPETLVAAEAAWAAEEARTVTCPRCGTSNAPDFEKCWSCEAVLDVQT